MFDIKSFYEADSVEDAIAALTADPQSQVISGGTDVLIRVREGKDAGRGLVGDLFSALGPGNERHGENLLFAGRGGVVG